MSTIKRNVGESISFTGGAEITPKVSVSLHVSGAFSMTDGDKNLTIEQNGQMVRLSAETMRSILKWAETEE